jgi:tetratricopeptide (TPR) repeat protein
MTERSLKVEQALRVLPEGRAIAPLREALISISTLDGEGRWSEAGEYSTLERRDADIALLGERIPALVERVRLRAEAVLRHSVQALTAAERGEMEIAAEEMIHAGEVLENDRELEEAERFYRQAVVLGRKPRDRRVEGLAHCRLARVRRAAGAWADALVEYEAGFEIADACRDQVVMVLACQGMGNVQVDRGDWTAAREWYERGLVVLRGSPPSRAEWELCSNLAIVARRSGSLAESEGWLLRAEGLVESLEDATGRVFLQNGWGRLHIARLAPAAAEAAFRLALSAAGAGGGRGVVLVNLAESLLLQGRLDEAEQVARGAEEAALLDRSLSLLPEIYRVLGRIAGERGRRDGFVFFEQSLALLPPGAPLLERATTQHQYGLFEAGMRDFDNATARLTEAIEIYRSLGAEIEAAEAEEALALLDTETDHSPA